MQHVEEEARQESRPKMRYDLSVEGRRGDVMHIYFDMSGAYMVNCRIFINNLNNEFDRCKWTKGGGTRWIGG